MQEIPQNLEQEIARIEQDLASKRAALESQQKSGEISEIPHEKETLKEIIKEQYSPSSSVPTQQTDQSQQVPVGQNYSANSPSYLSPELKEKVQTLIDAAFNKGLTEALKEAKATNNAALIDAFHDALVDELYAYLVERGKLKKI